MIGNAHGYCVVVLENAASQGLTPRLTSFFVLIGRRVVPRFFWGEWGFSGSSRTLGQKKKSRLRTIHALFQLFLLGKAYG
jgi:hypothetical protein